MLDFPNKKCERSMVFFQCQCQCHSGPLVLTENFECLGTQRSKSENEDSLLGFVVVVTQPFVLGIVIFGLGDSGHNPVDIVGFPFRHICG